MFLVYVAPIDGKEIEMQAGDLDDNLRVKAWSYLRAFGRHRSWRDIHSDHDCGEDAHDIEYCTNLDQTKRGPTRFGEQLFFTLGQQAC